MRPGRLAVLLTCTAFANLGATSAHAATVVQRDGDIVVARGHLLTSYLASGVADRAFGGGDGVVEIPPRLSRSVLQHFDASGAAVQVDGSIVVEGVAIRCRARCSRAVRAIRVVRFTPAGVLDHSFGGGDGFTDLFAPKLPVGDLAIQPDGRILVTGTIESCYGPRGNCTSMGVLSRLTADGSLDPTFGDGDGTTVVGTSAGPFDPPPHIVFSDVSVDPAGGIIAGGSTFFLGGPPEAAVVRFDSRGTPDPAFGGGDGIVNLRTPVDDVLPAPGGAVLAGGAASSDFEIARLRADGSLDASFGGGDGIASAVVGVPVAISSQGAMVRQPGGRLIVGGSYSHDCRGPGYPPCLVGIGLVGFDADGSLDPTFAGGDGLVTADFERDASNTLRREVDLAGSDGLVATGEARFDSGRLRSTAIVSLSSDGSIDDKFGRHGVVLDPPPTRCLGLLGPDDRPGWSTRISGTLGSDRLFGSSIDDVINGRTGDDRVLAFDGSDVVCGNGGDDQLRGGAGSDMISGGRGGDLVSGGTGGDTLIGGPGTDVLLGGADSDLLRGGNGADRIYAFDRKRDTVVCGAGNDTVVADTTDRASACEHVSRMGP